jgi:hypothetical protein
MLRKRPPVSRRPSGTWETTRRDTGPSGSGPARRKAGLRSARRHRRGRSFGSGIAGQDRVSARELRNRRTQDLGPWTPGGTEASAEDSAAFGTRASAEDPGWREAGREFQIRQRRTVRASALSGSQRGNRMRLRPPKDPGGSGARTPGSGAATRNRPERDASPPRLGSGNGTVGAGGNVGPHYLWRRVRSDQFSSFRGQSSRCRPVSRQSA